MAHPAMLSEFAEHSRIAGATLFQRAVHGLWRGSGFVRRRNRSLAPSEIKAKNCRYEYRGFQYAYRALIEPYVEQRLVEKVKAKQLMNFAPIE
jgi:hypothetical protein